jgi:glycosyltransferase involved in cell wall biosynthesis
VASELTSENRVFGIVVSAFNGIHLRALLNSLLGQSDNRFDVLIVDDSNNNLIGKEFVERYFDDRFALRTNTENLGPFRSWNAGLSELLARRKYRILAVIHEDDILDKDYVKHMIDAVDLHPNIDVYHSRVKIIGRNGNYKFSFQDVYKALAHFTSTRKVVISFGDSGLARILTNNFVFCPTMVFNASKFRSVEFNTRWKMVGDLEFISTALLEGRSFLRLPEKNYYYRRHDDNLTTELTRTTKRFEEEVELYVDLVARCSEVGFDKSAAVAKKARIIKLHIRYRMMISLIRFDIAGFRRLFDVLSTIGM